MVEQSIILKELNENGIYRFDEPFVGDELAERALCAADEFFAQPGNDYEFGTACRIGGYNSRSENAIHKLFSNELIWRIAKGFFGAVPSFSEIFLTHDYISEGNLARNGWLHFDRIPTLKFFMYLTDVDKNSGPFCYVPGTYKLGKEMRKKSRTEEREYKNIKNRLEVDFPELGYTAAETTPVVGPSGTMFIFHTDLFHCGGNTSTTGERKIVRLHLRE